MGEKEQGRRRNVKEALDHQAVLGAQREAGWLLGPGSCVLIGENPRPWNLLISLS